MSEDTEEVIKKEEVKDELNDNIIDEKTSEKEELQVVQKAEVSNTLNFKDNFMSKKYAKPLIIIMALVFFIVIVFSIFVCINKLNVNVYKNVYVLGEDVSGYSSTQLIEFLTNKNSERQLDIYQGTENIYSLKSSEINFEIDVTNTANNIIGFGRSKNVFLNAFDILKSKFRNVEIEPVYKYDNEKLEEAIKNIDLSLINRFVEDTYSVDNENSKLIITKGKKGNSIEYDEVSKSIVAGFENDKKALHLMIYEKFPETINAEEVYQKVKKDPKDAYIDRTSTPIKFVKEEVGIDFSVEELKKELKKEENNQEGKIIEFTLQKVEPDIKLQDITYDMYNDKLAGYTTYFDASNYARGNNLAVALKYLNEKVIMPGEVFSYNDAIGDTTSSKGYLPAAVFKGGTVVNEIGGGICQTTSTLYNVALMANLEIVERHQHGLPVGYVPPSRDATVYIGVLDFKFKNTRNYPIKIMTSFSWNGTMNISIYGTKEENEYEVILGSQVLYYIPYTTRYNYDVNMPQGEMVITSKGVNGYVSEGYITKKLNGQVVSTSVLSRDTYKAQQEIVTCGTGNTES